MIIPALLKIVSRCRTGWDIGGSVIAADCGVQSPFIRAMDCRYLRCSICVIASQYATSHCKRLLFWFPCKLLMGHHNASLRSRPLIIKYINIQTFDLSRLCRIR